MQQQTERRIPSLRRHKPSQQGVVTLNGRDHYLGSWPASRRKPPEDVQAAYDAKIAEWLAGGRLAEDNQAEALTVAELLDCFWTHAQKHYRDADGNPTNEQAEYKYAMRPVLHLYADLPAAEFSPLKLKAVRLLMVNGYTHPKYGEQPPLARKVINQRIGRICRIWKWAVADELAPETVYRALRAVRGLEKGRTEARETEAVPPVAEAVVDATLPHLHPTVQAMVKLQLYTGMRSTEVCIMRTRDLDTTSPVWTYRPRQHKTAHRGKERVIALGPRAQLVLRPWLRLELEAYIFSPAEAMEALAVEKRAKRKTRVQPSQQNRRRRAPKVRPGNRYDRTTYYRAIERACDRAFPLPEHLAPRMIERKEGKKPRRESDAAWWERLTAEEREAVRAWQREHRWHPHQLRHTHATEVRRKFGLEAAQVALGHSSADVTQVYVERDLALAVRVAAEIG
jgi:integrase